MRWYAFKEEMKDFFRGMAEIWPVWLSAIVLLITGTGLTLYNNYRISQMPTISLIREQWECTKDKVEVQVYSAEVVSFKTVCTEYRRK